MVRATVGDDDEYASHASVQRTGTVSRFADVRGFAFLVAAHTIVFPSAVSIGLPPVLPQPSWLEPLRRLVTDCADQMTRLSAMRSLPPADLSSNRSVSCVTSLSLPRSKPLDCVESARARSSSTQVKAVFVAGQPARAPKTVLSRVDQARSSFPVVTE